MKIHENLSLKKFNSFGVEAFAKYFVEILTLNDLRELVERDIFKQLPHFVIGGGSNILFTNDYDGIIIKSDLKGIDLVKEANDNVYLKCGSGEVWDDIVKYAVENNYGGIENLALIPGTIGAAPIQNIGAYGVELRDSFYSLEAFHFPTKETKVFNAEECDFGYRTSFFKQNLSQDYLILSVILKLKKNPKLNLQYKALKDYFEENSLKVKTIHEVYNAVCEIRNSKLPDPMVLGNAGSFFKNPIVSRQKLEYLKEKYPEIVAFQQMDSGMKLAAGWLIEAAGWKGRTIGKAGVHEKQALVIVNHGGADGKDIIFIANSVQKSVYDKFGVQLEAEVNIL